MRFVTPAPTDVDVVGIEAVVAALFDQLLKIEGSVGIRLPQRYANRRQGLA